MGVATRCIIILLADHTSLHTVLSRSVLVYRTHKLPCKHSGMPITNYFYNFAEVAWHSTMLKGPRENRDLPTLHFERRKKREREKEQTLRTIQPQQLSNCIETPALRQKTR